MFDQETEKQPLETGIDPIEKTDDAQASFDGSETTAAPKEEKDSPIETEAEDTGDNPLEDLPAETSLSEGVPTDPLPDSEAPAEKSANAPLPNEPTHNEYKTKTKIAAFFFFAITLAVFVLYEYFSAVMLYAPIASSPGNFGEALAAIFGYLFGFIITLIFGVVQLPENIISIILFKRLRGKSCKKWENILFTVCFALSIVMLIVTLLSFALFVGVISLNH